jgi:hypothetical protein
MSHDSHVRLGDFTDMWFRLSKIGIELDAFALGRGLPFSPFRLARWVHNSTIATFSEAPL